MKYLYFYLCLFALMPIWVVESNENLDSTMCPRFHVDEFVWSVFQPTLRKNLDFVLNLAKVSIDGVEELLITLEQKKGIEAIDVAERIQKVVNEMRQKIVNAINKAEEHFEATWKTELENYTTNFQLQDVWKRIRATLQETEDELGEVFQAIVIAIKPLIDPVVQVLVKSTEEKPMEEQQKHKEMMINQFKSRDKILAYVMGKLVISALDQKTIEQKTLLDPITSLMRDLSDDFFAKARTMPIDKFWKEFLKPRWSDLHAPSMSQEEETDEFVDTLTSFYYHTKANKA